VNRASSKAVITSILTKCERQKWIRVSSDLNFPQGCGYDISLETVAIIERNHVMAQPTVAFVIHICPSSTFLVNELQAN
jgi:hypothetical protein